MPVGGLGPEGRQIVMEHRGGLLWRDVLEDLLPQMEWKHLRSCCSGRNSLRSVGSAVHVGNEVDSTNEGCGGGEKEEGVREHLLWKE